MVGAMTTVVPVAPAGAALEVPCANGGQRRYRLRLAGDDVVITTVAEHRANVLEWSRAANCRYVECGKDRTFDTEDVVAALSQWPRPALLAITGESGITDGCRRCRRLSMPRYRRGVPVLADVTELAPHHPLPADADFLVWSGYKMYAPFGAGVLIGPRREGRQLTLTRNPPE